MKIMKIALLSLGCTLFSSALTPPEVPSIISKEDKVLRVLYIAFFDRAPDVSGLKHWKDVYTKEIDTGKDSKEVFTEISSEFFKNSQSSTLTEQSNRAFVESVYKNQLGELGDQEGINFWTGLLDKGLSRSEFMAEFVTKALDVKSDDITEENFPNFSSIELEIAKKRVKFLDDKVDLSVKFTDTFGEFSNPVDMQNLENDPAYRVSQLIMEELASGEEVNSINAIMENGFYSTPFGEEVNATIIMNEVIDSLTVKKELKKYKELWNSKNIKNYSYKFHQVCECLESEDIHIEVDDNEVVEATYTPSNSPVEEERLTYLKTVDEYFDLIESSIENNVSKIEVKYNKRYGYPTSIYIDIDKQIADEEKDYSLTNFVVSGEEYNSRKVEKINIPFREIGYAQHPSMLITSQEKLDTLIETISSQKNWNNRGDFIKELNNLDINFDIEESLLFYRITEGSGSIQLSVEKPILSPDKEDLLITIKKDIPNIQTTDMAYYGLAYIIGNGIKQITIQNGEQEVIIENKSSDMIIPKNCQTWFDGCNTCAKSQDGEEDEICTTNYCLVYRPEDFRCTAWE